MRLTKKRYWLVAYKAKKQTNIVEGNITLHTQNGALSCKMLTDILAEDGFTDVLITSLFEFKSKADFEDWNSKD